jgi:hypothetical protein
MNERIIELRKKAWDLVQTDLQINERDEPVSEREQLKMVFDKFAELIVRECAEKVDWILAEDGKTQGDLIKEHFGVEE